MYFGGRVTINITEKMDSYSKWRIRNSMKLFNKNKKVPFSNYSQFVEHHLDALYKTAYRLTGGQVEAEDLVQNLVIKLQPRFDELLELEKPLIWMNKVLYRMFIDYRRQVNRSPVRSLSELDMDDNADFFDSVESVDASPYAIIEKAELTFKLQNALNQLNEDDRSLIVLYEVEGHSIGEIHEITGMPNGTIKSKLYRARTQLRKFLKNETDLQEQACNVVRI